METPKIQQLDNQNKMELIEQEPSNNGLDALADAALRAYQLNAMRDEGLKKISDEVLPSIESLRAKSELLRWTFFRMIDWDRRLEAGDPNDDVCGVLTNMFGDLRDNFRRFEEDFRNQNFGEPDSAESTLELARKGATARMAIMFEDDRRMLKNRGSAKNLNYAGSRGISIMLGNKAAPGSESTPLRDQAETVVKVFEPILKDDRVKDLLEGFNITLMPGTIADLGEDIANNISSKSRHDVEILILSITNKPIELAQ